MLSHPVTLKQLHYLLSLEEAGHFRIAAERAGVTQPSLSAQIQNLELALGTTLVERRPRGATLTVQGREVASRARQVLNDVQSIIDVARMTGSSLSGTIRLGAKATLGPYLLPHVVADLHKSFPELKLYIREAAPRELSSELERGVHDLILAQLPVSHSGFEVRRLFREPLWLAVASDHSFARRDTVEVEDLRGQDVLSVSPRYHLHDQVGQLCNEFGARLRQDYEGTSLDALRQMVGMGMGITFLPAIYAQTEISPGSDVVARPIRNRQILRSIALVWRASTPSDKAFDTIAKAIRSTARRKFPHLIFD